MLLLSCGRLRAAELGEPTQKLSLEGVWLFHAGDNASFARVGLDDYSWNQHHLPTLSTPWTLRWQGYGWYRYHFTAREEAVGAEYMINLGPAREVVEVYVNGALVAERGRFGSRLRGGAKVSDLLARVPSGILRKGDNLIALRVYDPSWTMGFPHGPLLLGPVDTVRSSVSTASRWALPLRVFLGLLALLLGAAQVASHFRRRVGNDFWWLAGVGVMLSIHMIAGVGFLESLVPNLHMVARLPAVATCLAMLCMGSYFASRYGDLHTRRVMTGQVSLLVLAAVLLLAPDSLVFLVGDAALVLGGMITVLYVTHLLAQSARRQERGAIPVFASLTVLAMTLVYDGITASSSSALPPVSSATAVGVLAVTTLVSARQTGREHETVLLRMLEVRRQLEGLISMNMLDAATMAALDIRSFLGHVVHQVSRQLAVRRCSIVMPRRDGSLRIRASVGLPTHAIHSQIDPHTSITGWAFTRGLPVTPRYVPPEVSKARSSRYATDAFIAQPVQHAGRTLGVLNVSDRNDGGSFSSNDEAAVAEVAEKIGLILFRAPDLFGPWEELDHPDPVQQLQEDDLVHTAEKGEKAKEVAPERSRNTGVTYVPPELASGLHEEALESTFDEALGGALARAEAPDEPE